MIICTFLVFFCLFPNFTNYPMTLNYNDVAKVISFDSVSENRYLLIAEDNIFLINGRASNEIVLYLWRTSDPTWQSYAISHCLFEGYEKSDIQNIARIMFCNTSLTALIKIGRTFYSIETIAESSYVIRRSDMPNRLKREFIPEARSEFVQHYYVEIVVFVAYDFLASLGSIQEAQRKAIELVYFADFYYAAIPNLNIHLNLKDVIVWDLAAKDPLRHIRNINEYLDAFQMWHENHWDSIPVSDHAVVVTLKDFGTDIGLAYRGSLCTGLSSRSVIRETNEGLAMIASTLAHELGHSFGLSHSPPNEDDPCFCGDEDGCVMDAIAGQKAPQLFHKCQRDFIRSKLNEGAFPCLNNVPQVNQKVSICGDYVTDTTAEECDCGPIETCNDSCCHASNCTLKMGALCSSMDPCCDPDTCRVRNSSYLCRDASGQCDVKEFCDGEYPKCPADTFSQSGIECSPDEVAGLCYLGKCLSADIQCHKLFEAAGVGKVKESCWSKNAEGDKWGNCGKFRNGTFKKCSTDDKRCGKLQCWNAESDKCTSKPEFTPLMDDSEDYSYVLNGTPCGENSFCHDKKCITHSHTTDTDNRSEQTRLTLILTLVGICVILWILYYFNTKKEPLEPGMLVADGLTIEALMEPGMLVADGLTIEEPMEPGMLVADGLTIEEPMEPGMLNVKMRTSTV